MQSFQKREFSPFFFFVEKNGGKTKKEISIFLGSTHQSYPLYSQLMGSVHSRSFKVKSKKYILKKKIGDGGFSEVFLVKEKGFFFKKKS